jgi:hemerythrin superfamily protein
MAKKQTRGSANDNQNTSEERNAIQVLESQHREVERLFQSLGTKAASGDMEPIVLQIIDKLVVHASIEERHFYPAARAADTEDLIDESYDDHQELKELCLHLLDIGASDENYQAKVEELQGLVEDHVSIEESELFPLASDLLGADDLQELAQQMAATMTELEEEGDARSHLSAEVGATARE